MKSLGGFHELDALGYVSVAIFLDGVKLLEAKKEFRGNPGVGMCKSEQNFSLGTKSFILNLKN